MNTRFGQITRKTACLLGALATAALGCGGSTALPAGFGVNLTIRLDGGIRDQVHTVDVQVSGAEQFDKIVDITAFSATEARIRYVPGVQAGVLVFSANALDASGAIVAQGTSGPVTLVANQAVNAVVEIGGAGDGGADAARDGGGDAPGSGKKGEPCGAGGACRLGLTCADGVCCDTACQGTCSACNLTGREGTCSPVPAGTAPATGHTTCGTDAPSTCQKDGTCDGNGACRMYPVGTTCRASKCDPTTDAFTPDFKCDGRGVCDSNIAIPCAPFKCKDASTCFNTCTDGTQCAAGKSCVGGSCGLKGPGATCVQASECASGSCADSVCCDTACTAGCASCVLPGKLGTCTAVPMGMDPKGVCPAGTAENAVCSPGGCDGMGVACLKASTATACRVGSCVAGIAVNPAVCQANGACTPITQTGCGVYTCGMAACNTACAADGDCVMGYYCAANNTCQAKKTPGLGCAANNECQLGLTCLDSVCCMTAACPNCRNCGSDGTCSLTVGSAAGTADTSGSACSGNNACNAAGVCLGILGQACGSGTGCVSGNCVDGVCCSVSSCGTCRNCGATGTCSVLVSNTDDASGTTCSNDNTCDATATCKARWTLVGKVATVEAPYSYFTTGVGNNIFFANPSNSSGGAQYIKAFNVTTNVFTDQAATANQLCACGYEGTLVGQPLDGRVYYAANSAVYFSAGAATWTPMLGTYPSRGEAATAVSAKRIYYVGGRGSLTSVQAYDTTAPATTAWITTGIADAPVAIDTGCAGAFGGVVYAFGGRTNAGMYAYTESTNKWAAVAAAPPSSCYLTNMPVWRSAKLVMSDGTFVRVFNPSTQLWETPIPLPALSGATGWSVATAGTTSELYVLGWVGAQTSIYKWVLN